MIKEAIIHILKLFYWKNDICMIKFVMVDNDILICQLENALILK